MQHGARRIPEPVRGALVVVAYSDFDDENLDLEIGFSLRQDRDKPIVLPSGVELRPAELPPAECLAALVRSGPNYQSHLAFGALGLWMDANRFEISGPSREVFLENAVRAAGCRRRRRRDPVSGAPRLRVQFIAGSI